MFNPSSDFALACGNGHYIPPKGVRMMEDGLAVLPLWWAEEDDCILMSDDTVRLVDSDTIGMLWRVLGAGGTDDDMKRIWECMHVLDSDDDRIASLSPCPWGWNLPVFNRFAGVGVNAQLMPDRERLSECRQLSSRSFACSYIGELFCDSRFDEVGDLLVGQGMRMISLDDVNRMNGSCPDSPVIFKTPWSSSGKGVWRADVGYPYDMRRVRNAVEQFGGLLVDDFYDDKLIDFALEFSVGDDVSFLGYSVFETSEGGKYGYNLVESQESLRSRVLSTGISEYLLDLVELYSVESLRKRLCGHYRGVVGIDMLVCRHDGKVKLHPCVEINLRNNMGVLSICVYKRIREALTMYGNGVVPPSLLLAGDGKGITMRLNGNKMMIDSSHC